MLNIRQIELITQLIDHEIDERDMDDLDLINELAELKEALVNRVSKLMVNKGLLVDVLIDCQSQVDSLTERQNVNWDCYDIGNWQSMLSSLETIELLVYGDNVNDSY